jgi:hypothetical protein
MQVMYKPLAEHMDPFYLATDRLLPISNA